MYQVPQAIWNEIAKSQPLSPLWMELFSAEDEDVPSLLEKLIYSRAKAADNRVLRALALVAPLLMESEAISQYIVETGQAGLRTSLPEVLSIDEAVILATQEFMLHPHQQKELAQLLRGLETLQQNVRPSATPTM